MAAMHVREFSKLLVKAGIITEEQCNRAVRVVIDVDPNKGPVMIYIQEIGDKTMLGKLAPMLEGMIPDGG